jgi:hypothetical protein
MNMPHAADLHLGRILTAGSARSIFTVPSSLATQTVAVLARKGAGKTYTMKRIVESLLAVGGQVIVIDAVGVWYGLRLDASGAKASRFTVPILGGWRGDIDLAPSAGALVASTLVETGQSAVLDVSKFRKGDRKTFATDFAEELLHLKKDPARRSPLFVVLEEAQLLAPQKVQKGEERMLGAFEDLVKLGRNYGIGVGMISQRPQSINKDILNQTELLIVLQTNGPQERKTIEGWILENDAAGVDLVAELPKLQTGEAFVWSPGWLRYFGKVKIDACATFDASATPTGSTAGAGELKPIDLGSLKVAMAAVVEERQANDPRRLKEEIATLKGLVLSFKDEAGQLREEKAARDAAPPAPALTEEDWQRLDALVDRFEQARTRIAAVVDGLAGQIGQRFDQLREDLAEKVPAQLRAEVSDTLKSAIDRVAFVETVRKVQGLETLAPLAPEVQRAMDRFVETRRAEFEAEPPRGLRSPAPRASDTTRRAEGATGLKRGARTMLEALATAPRCRLTRQDLSTRAGIKMGGTFSDYLSALRTRGFILEDNKEIAITPDGLAVVGPNVAPLTRARVLARHASRLKAGARRMFDVLEHRAHKRAELAEKAGIAQGGTFSDYLSSLRTAGLITERDGFVAWSDTFRALR